MDVNDSSKRIARLRFTTRRIIKAKGLRGLVSLAVRRLLHIPVTKPPRMIEHPFDQRNGIRTGGYRNVATSKDQFDYYGISPSVFRKACSRWIETLESPQEVERYCFIDLGCGMGRALLLASELHFRNVIGIELDERLVSIARRNVEIWTEQGQAKTHISVHQGDARDLKFPQTPFLIFLYNPFGEETLREIISRLPISSDDSVKIDVLYCHPKHGYVFEGITQFREVWMASIELDQEDRAVDAFYNTVEVCSEYRLSHIGHLS